MENIERKVQYIAKSVPAIDGAGVRLKRAFGNLQGVNLDPFLLLDDIHSNDPKDFIAGFPWHPHRGMETVSYLVHGKFEHEDSLGNKGTIKGGEIQWMTAGSGIIHQEMPVQYDGLIRGFQLWVNLPSKHKMMQPRYQDIKKAEIKDVTIDNLVTVKVLAGDYNGVSGPVKGIISDPTYLDIHIDQENSFEYVVPSDHTAMLYILEGEGYFDSSKEKLVDNDNLVVFGKGNRIKIETDKKDLRFLLMTGEPINEPVAWQGPIVMNTQQELRQAFSELQTGKFIKHEYRI
jgi:hypothetical protein